MYLCSIKHIVKGVASHYDGWYEFINKKLINGLEKIFTNSNKDSGDELFDGKGERIRIPEKRGTEKQMRFINT